MRRHFEKIVLAVLVLASLAGVHIYTLLYTPASRAGSLRSVVVPKGASFRVIARNLERAGVVRDAEDFVFVAGLVGAYKKVQAGEYELSTSMTPVEILGRLTAGKVKEYSVTIPEGYSVSEVASVLEEAGLVSRDEFLSLAGDRKFISSLGFDEESLEGYLFPDTYIFTRGMGAEDIIAKMTRRFLEVYEERFDAIAREAGMTRREVITLASIIEKETGVPAERRRISSVFHNRLKRGIPLQSDPTVIYAIEDFNGNLTKKDLLTWSPYNTYMNRGLPPGPISNPGMESIDAALNPSEEGYLYFVSRNDGTHHFSRNLDEHNRAVELYQKGLRGATKEGPSG